MAASAREPAISDELQTRYTVAIAQTTAAKQAVDDLRASLASRGLTLNIPLATAVVRMQAAIEEAGSAMERAQAAAATVMRTFGR
jgi:hypothetical protein